MLTSFSQFDKTYAERFKGRLPIAPTVLPAVYDDVLSYEEWLSKIRYKIEELGAYIEEQLKDVEALITTEVDAKLDTVISGLREKYDAEIKDLQDRVTECESGLLSLDEKIERRYLELKDYIDNKLVLLKAEFSAEIHRYYLMNNEYTDNKINRESIYRRADIKSINDRLDNYISEFPLVYCPPLGQYTNVETAIVEVWDSLRMFALTASEYDNFDFTCTEYSDLLFSAFEYDVYGGYFLRENVKEMFNPFTGKHENVRNVVTDICDYLKFNGKTAGEYDAYEFTASEFDNSDYTAYPQDTSKYWTTPADDLKNKYIKNYVKMFEDTQSQTQGADGVNESFEGVTKGFIVYLQNDSQSALESIELAGVGTFRVSNDNGYRDITISVLNDDSYTVEWTDNYSDPQTYANQYNIVRAVYRIGGAYDVTKLNA